MLKTTNYKLLLIILVISILSILVYLIKISGEQTTNITKPNSQLQITTSFYPLYFFTTQIVQDKADVHNITPAGAEPHDYEPTAKDMVKIENSQLLIINGGKLEAWADNIQNILNKKNTLVVIAGENIINKDTQIRDPHIWLSPLLAKKEVETITKSIIAVDPINSQFYIKNSESLITKLENLHNQFKKELSNCNKKDVITSHAAFGYLAQEYGLNQISISGLSPDEEPSLKKLAEIAGFAKKNKVKYIFFESLVSPKLASTIAQEAGAKTIVLNPLGGLTNEEIKDGKNYFTEMQNNLINLKIALECL